MYDSAVAELADEQKQQATENNFKLATVTELFTTDSCAKITFYGEDTPSEKEYSYLAWYAPTVGDKVLLSRVGDSWVILGKVNYAVAPEGLSREDVNAMIFSILEQEGYVKLTGNGTISNDSSSYNYFNKLEATTFQHSGSYLGFYNYSPVQQKSLLDLSVSESTTVQNVGNKLNELMNLLGSYGLIKVL